MKFQIELTVQTDEGAPTSEIISFEREYLADDTLGLSLDEASNSSNKSWRNKLMRL